MTLMTLSPGSVAARKEAANDVWPVSKAATPQGHRGELQGFLGPNTCVHTYTLWLFIDDFPIKTFIYKGFSMA